MLKPIKKDIVINREDLTEKIVTYNHDIYSDIKMTVFYINDHICDVVFVGHINRIRIHGMLPADSYKSNGDGTITRSDSPTEPHEIQPLQCTIYPPAISNQETMNAIVECNSFINEAIEFVKELQTESRENRFDYEKVPCPEIKDTMTLNDLLSGNKKLY